MRSSPPDLSHWYHLEEFQLHVAACLIAGVLPRHSRRYPLPQEIPSEAGPYLELLVMAYLRGEAVRAGAEYSGDRRALLDGLPPEKAAFLGVQEPSKRTPPTDIRRIFSVVVQKVDVHRWLEFKGIKPRFPFSPPPRDIGVPATNESFFEPTAETAEQRQARRFQACIDANLQMPDNDYERLPRGINRVADAEGISRQAFTDDIKAHIRRRGKRADESAGR